MSFNSNEPTEKQTDSTVAAIKYLRQGWNAQAFLLLSEPGSEKNPAARFALGLCYLHADDISSAIPCFEQALNLLRASPPAAVAKGENSEMHIKLAKGQIEEKAYLTPMDPDFCTSFPKAAEQTVILAMIHVYQKKGMTDMVQRLSSGLTGPVFEEYKNRLTESQK